MRLPLTRVSAIIFEKAIVGELMEQYSDREAKRSVVMVTNSLQFLNHSKVSRILVLQDGRIVEQGSFTDLTRTKKSFFSRLLSNVSDSSLRTQNVNVCASTSDSVLDGVPDDAKDKEVLGTGMSKTMTEETRMTGHVSIAVYWSWAKAAGGVLAPLLIVVTFAFGEAMQVLSNWFLTYWSSHAEADTQKHFLFMYAIITFCSASADTLRILAVIGFSLVASRRLFTNMLASILHAPMSFFDTTPIGRIVNRFTKGKWFA